MISDHHMKLLQKAYVHPDAIELKLLEEENPVELSRAGRNHLSHHCDIYEGRPFYCVCLNIMDKVMEGDERMNKDCAQAIKNKTCPAMEMRLEELKAGRALFYVDYQKARELREKVSALREQEALIKFGRRNRAETKFKPTIIVPEKNQADSDKKENKKPIEKEAELDFNQNIFEKIVNKVLAND